MDMVVERDREQNEHLDLVLLNANALQISRIDALQGAGEAGGCCRCILQEEWY